MWDDRIDEAARELTGDASGGELKARVLGRIAEGTRGSGLGAGGWRLGAGAPGLGARLARLSSRALRVIEGGDSGLGARRWGWGLGALAAAVLIAVVMFRDDRSATTSDTTIVRDAADISLPALPALSERQRVEGPALPAGFASFAPEPIAIARIDVAALEPPTSVVIDALSIAPIAIPALDSAIFSNQP